MRGYRGIVIAAVVAGLIVLLMGGSALAAFLAELFWYRSLNLDNVFWTHWRGALIVRGTATVLILSVIAVNLMIVTRSLGAIRVRRRYGNIEIAERLPQGYLIGTAMLISAFSAWWLSAGFADPLPILAAFNPVGWGVRDPAFGFDAAFYVFQLPVLSRIQTMGSVVIFWISLLAIAAYASTGAIRVVDGRPTFTRIARRHLGVLAAAFLVFFAMNVWLDRYWLVVDGNGFGGALGYADMYARLPAKLVVIGLLLLTAASIGYGAWVGNLRLAVASGFLLVLGLIGAEAVYPSSIQRFVVEPNQFPRESPFIERQIEFTRLAFNLHDIERVAMPYEQRVDIEPEALVSRLEGIPMWDPRPLMTTYQAQQGLFRRYAFASVHHDRYGHDGEVEPVAISVRELDTSELEPAAQTWQNLHLNYVSGAGAVASPAARMSSNGTPIFYVWDLDPPKLAPDAPPELALTDPRIYFGERATEYVIVGDDHPPIGVALDATWRKALFAWYFRSKNILLSGDLQEDSRIVFRRRIAERVQAAAPFLYVPMEGSAYPVIADGHVVWVVDAYTMSSSFPLSPLVGFDNRGVRYVRNSVKATVDAVTGEVRLFAIDPADPILKTYSAIFPDLLGSFEEIPETIREHMRFPVRMMTLQAQVIGAYHLLDPRQFYEQQDVWAIAVELYRGTPSTMEPTYSLFPLPGQEEPEFLLSLPFVARGRQNMTALMVTRNDPPNYGKQILYLLPRDEQIPGPQQIDAAIDQDPEISQQLALWRRGGSDVLRGHLVVMPVNGTLLYVEPLFLEAENAAIPQLERVIIAQAGRVVMEPTFEAAALRLVGGQGSGGASTESTEAATSPDSAPPAAWEPMTRARQLLDEAEAFLRAGDWAGFGRALQNLRAALSAPPPSP
jgi:uncharacterized membrane protein (UPF0182 family)